MFDNNYTKDPYFYLTIAGGCSTLVCCLVCIAKNWDEPPDWAPKCCQPSWKKKYFYDDDKYNKRSNKITLREDDNLV